MKVFIRSNIDDYDQVRSISEVIDSADEEELPPPPQEQANTSYVVVQTNKHFFSCSPAHIFLGQ